MLARLERMWGLFGGFLLLGLSCVHASVSAQPHAHPLEKSQFYRLQTPGLDSLSIVSAIAQDEQGFMWFGGKNGLARFDGYEVRLFRHDPDIPGTISSNDISDMLVADNGDLWIATLSAGGLNHYDRRTEQFIHYKFEPDHPNSISSDSIYAIEQDQQGRLWMGTYEGVLDSFDPQTQTFKAFAPPNRMGYEKATIRDLQFDGVGQLWLVTQGAGVDRFDPTTRTFTNYSLAASGQGEPELYSILVRENGDVWVGSFSEGIFVLDSRGHLKQRFQYDLKDANSLGSGMVWDMWQDQNGEVWVATGDGHLNYFDADKQLFIRIHQNRFNKKSPSNTITSMYQDKAGDFWFGSYFSTVDFVSPDLTVFDVLDLSAVRDVALWPKNITAMAVDAADNLWIASDSGLSHYDFEHKDLDTKLHLEAAGLYDFPITAITVDSEQHVWLGTLGGGVYQLDRSLNVKAHYTLQNGLKDLKVWSLYEDSDGTIWAGTQAAGIAFLKGKRFKHLPIAKQSTEMGLSNRFVWDIKEGKNQDIWIATQWGLNKFNKRTKSITQYISTTQKTQALTSNVIRGLSMDNQENIWLATDNGLHVYDYETGKIKHLKAANQMEDMNLSAVVASEGHVWYATQKGVGKYDMSKNRFYDFDTRHGVNGSAFVRNTGVQLGSGSVGFGGAEGVTIVRPNEFKENTFLPPVAFTDFSILHESVSVSDSGPLTEGINTIKDIYLNPDLLFFSIEFSALSYRVPSLNRYAYMLEGFDDKWHEVSAKARRVTYTNLSPGSYRFKVKAANNDGLWSGIEKSVSIHVAPNWWQTLWFKTVLFLLFVVAVIIANNVKVGTIRKRQTLLKTLVSKKTEELASANASIKQLNAELEERVEQRTQELSIEVEERRNAEARLYHMAFHDSLTELPNRFWLIQELKKLIELQKADRSNKFALFFLDGDRFKQVNDTHGHVLGDQLLVYVAKRLRSLMPEHHHVVRLGGDEFTILIDEASAIGHIVDFAADLVAAFDEPFFIDDIKIFFRVSVGIVICEDLYSKPEQILRDADIALYRAKDSGRGTYQIFDSKMREETIELSELENDLHNAIQRHELFLEYQPIIDLNTDKLSGFEALLRWRHPERGLICPDRFIPIAEECSLIGAAGLRAFELACAQLAHWQPSLEKSDTFSMAVNVSSLQISQADLFEKIEGVIQEYGVAGRRLKLEITESALMEKSKTVKTLLENFRYLGVELAIDDFGTGYSSLSYLDQLPVQILKIDKSFVSSLAEDHQEGGASEIVRATISLAHNLNMKVVAEGIETESQWRALKRAGCDYGQGYWFSRPVAAAAASAMLAQLVERDEVFDMRDMHDVVAEPVKHKRLYRSRDSEPE